MEDRKRANIWDSPDYGLMNAPFPAIVLTPIIASGITPKYPFYEKMPAATNGVYISGNPARYDNSGQNYAVELNGAVVASGTLVMMRNRGAVSGKPSYDFFAGFPSTTSGTGFTGETFRVSDIACISGQIVTQVQTDVWQNGILLSGTITGSGAGSAVGVGITAITGGSDGKLLYDNNGLIGETVLSTLLTALGGITGTI